MRFPCVCLVLLALTIGTPSSAQIGLSPPMFKLEIGDQQITQTARLFNFSTDTSRVHVSVHNWDLDETNTVRILEPTEQSLDQWIVINPLSFAIPPGGSQAVRFSVRPRVQPEPGEHRALIYFTEELRPRGKHNVGLKLGAAVYGQSGPAVRIGTLHGVEVDALGASFEVTSKGNANVRISGQYAVWDPDAFPGSDRTRRIKNLGEKDSDPPDGILRINEIATTPFLPQTRRTLAVPFMEELPPGTYVLDINAKLGEEPIDQSLPFTVEPKRPHHIAD